MRYENGVPREIGDLSEEPAHNYPQGSSTRLIQDLVDHIRALSAFTAQLNSRVMQLELQMKLASANVTRKHVSCK